MPLAGAGGGNPLLWQHLFWFLAHPEVYVLVLPAMGIVAEVITSHARRPLWRYGADGQRRGGAGRLVDGGVGAPHVPHRHGHHAQQLLPDHDDGRVGAVGDRAHLPGASRCGAAPSASPRAMCFALAFLPMFGLGGVTGLPLGLGPSNVILHDTCYVVGHFHYLVAPGTLFALFAGVYHWFPKLTGRRLNERLGLRALHRLVRVHERGLPADVPDGADGREPAALRRRRWASALAAADAGLERAHDLGGGGARRSSSWCSSGTSTGAPGAASRPRTRGGRRRSSGPRPRRRRPETSPSSRWCRDRRIATRRSRRERAGAPQPIAPTPAPPTSACGCSPRRS